MGTSVSPWSEVAKLDASRSGSKAWQNNTVHDCAWNSDGLRLAFASADSTVRVWDVGTWCEVATLKRVRGIVRGQVTRCTWSPDGRGLHSFPFQLNLSPSVHHLTRLNS